MANREPKPFVVDLRKAICKSLQDSDEALPVTEAQLWERSKSLYHEADVAAVFKKHKMHRNMSSDGHINIVRENLWRCIEALQQEIPAQAVPKQDSFAGAPR